MALRKETIIKEALNLLNEDGLEGITLRKLAVRLNVKAPALYWHFKNKKALVNEMAESILRREFDNIIERKNDDPWQSWLFRIFNQLRKALLSYTDGGRVVAGAHLSLTMADLSERSISMLVNAGVELRRSRLIVLTATRFTFGHVIEEQTSVTEMDMQNFHAQQFNQEHPTLVAGIEEYFSSGKNVDDLFNDGLRMIINDP